MFCLQYLATTHLVTVRDLLPVATLACVVIIAKVAVVDPAGVVDAHVVDGNEDARVIGTLTVHSFLLLRPVEVTLHPQPCLLPAGGATVTLERCNLCDNSVNCTLYYFKQSTARWRN